MGSSPFLTLVSHLSFAVVAQSPLHNLLFQCPLVVVAQTLLQNPLFQSPLLPLQKSWLPWSLPFVLTITLCLLSVAFSSLCPLIFLKARPAGFGCFPPSPQRPVFTLCSSFCPSVSLPAESKGCNGLKGRTPDGHRHVEHGLCDGVWLRAL